MLYYHLKLFEQKQNLFKSGENVVDRSQHTKKHHKITQGKDRNNKEDNRNTNQTYISEQVIKFMTPDGHICVTLLRGGEFFMIPLVKQPVNKYIHLNI